jgi:hypothetical protein
MSFDEAQDRFRAKPSASTAAAYRAEAVTYYNDEMIGEGTYNAALREVQKWREAHQPIDLGHLGPMPA